MDKDYSFDLRTIDYKLKLTFMDRIKSIFLGKKKKHDFKHLENVRFKKNMQTLFDLKLI